jgi:cytochrome c peroxidase
MYFSPKFRGVLTAATLAAVMVIGCGGGGTSVVDTGLATAAWNWDLPKNFPVPAVPADNPMSEAKFQLGRFLFYDKRLSANGTTACASCHLQHLAFTDGKMTSVGATGQNTPRNAMPLANVVYHANFTWARPDLTSLEQQMQIPLYATDPIEMGLTESNEPGVLLRFKNDADYARRFEQAFPGEVEPVQIGNIIKAIAAFQRGILSGDSKFDRAAKGLATLTAAERSGADLFFTEKAECFHCHGTHNFDENIVYTGQRLPETPLFHNTGLYNIDGKGGFPAPNRGVFEVTQSPQDMGAFRPQTLRNVAVTAPYMHDGTIATLEEVVATYAAGGRNIPTGQPNAGDGRLNPYKDGLIPGINLSAQEQADIVAFLKTLTDETLLTSPRYANPFPSGSPNNP